MEGYRWRGAVDRIFLALALFSCSACSVQPVGGGAAFCFPKLEDIVAIMYMFVNTHCTCVYVDNIIYMYMYAHVSVN